MAASVWITFLIERFVTDWISPAQGADDAGRQRQIEAERIADGVGHLADLQVLRAADRDGSELALGRVDVQDGEILVGRGADQRGPTGGVIGQRDVSGLGILDDVKIRDDVAALVPDEAGAGALRHFLDVEAPFVALRRPCDVMWTTEGLVFL